MRWREIVGDMAPAPLPEKWTASGTIAPDKPMTPAQSRAKVRKSAPKPKQVIKT